MKKRVAFGLLVLFSAIPSMADMYLGGDSGDISWWAGDRTYSVSITIHGNVYANGYIWYVPHSTIAIEFYDQVHGDYGEDGRILDYINGGLVYSFQGGGSSDPYFWYSNATSVFSIATHMQTRDRNWLNQPGDFYDFEDRSYTQIVPDNNAPTITSPASVEWHGTALQINYSVSQPSGPGVASVVIARKAGTYVGGLYQTSDLPISGNGSSFIAPSAGIYTITATDHLGVFSVATIYVKDVTAPSIAVGGVPANGAARSVTVTATASEIAGDTGLSLFQVTQYSQSQNLGTLNGPSTVPIATPYSQTFSTTGLYQLLFTAKDHASSIAGVDSTTTNPANGVPLTFKVLAQPPHISVPSGTNGWYTNPQSLFISFTDDYGTVLEGFWQEPSISSTWTSLGGQDASHPVLPLILPDGLHTINLKTTDAAGQTTTTSYAINVETANPTLSISFQYGTSTPVLLQGRSTAPNYLHGHVGFLANRSALSGFDSEAQYTVGSSSGSLASFVPLAGGNIYTFTTTDIAGNTGTVQYTITYSTQATALPLTTLNTTTSPYLYAGVQNTLVGSASIATNSVFFKVPKSAFLSDPNYYAPPGSVAVSFDGGSAQTYVFSDDGVGNYVTTSIDVTGLTEGPHTLSWTLSDQSGASSTGEIDFTLHRTPPVSVGQGLVGRTSLVTSVAGSAVWVPDGSGGWQIAQADAANVVSGTGSDGVVVNGYTDTAQQDTSLFPLSGYQVVVSDPLSSSGATSLAFGAPYTFTWGAENSRTLSITVVDEAGVSSQPMTVTLLKPVWGGLAAPTKVVGTGSFSVQWADDGTSVPNGVKGVNWGSSSSSLGNFASESQGTVTVAGVAVGSTVYYQEEVTLSQAGSATTPKVTVIGDGFSGATVGSYLIPYEMLAAASLPSRVAFITSSGTLSLPSLPPQAADGQNIQYALVVGLDSGGTISNPTYVPANQFTGEESFTYSLLSAFGQPDVPSLRAYLQGKTVDLRVDAWYGQPLGASWPPVLGQNASTVTSGATKQVGTDFDPPVTTFTGMMGSANPITSSKAVSGSASDVGGSHLAQVQVSWAPVVGGSVPANAVYTPMPPVSFVDSSGRSTLDNGTFSIDLKDASGNPLSDGWYSIQVVVSDGAGNGWNNGGTAVVKVIDTTPPTLVGASVQATTNGVDAGSGAYLTNSDGSISVSLQTNDNSGSGLGSIQYEWTDRTDQPIGTQGWVTAAIYPSAAFAQQLVGAESHVATVVGAPAGIGKLHIRLVDVAGNVGSDSTDSKWIVSYNPNPPLVSGIVVAGLVNNGGSYYVVNPAGLQVSWTPAAAADAADVQWGVSANGGATVWSGWGAGFGTVSSQISVDGASYQIQFMARNANGQSTGVLSSPVFIKDSVGPTNVSASLSGNGSYVAGQPIAATVAATSSASGLSWSWSYHDESGGAVVSSGYQAGDSVVIPRQGNFQVTFTATSGSGISAASSAIRVTITGVGLVVRDFQRYSDGQGVIGGAWSYVGGSPSGFQYQWVTAGGQVLQGWTAGDRTQSTTVSLASVTGTTPLAAGEVVQLEVRALDASGQAIADVTSSGSLVDTSGPVFGATSGPASPSGMKAPAYVTPSDVWVQFQGQDAESGIAGASLLVKKLVTASDGSWSWLPVSAANISSDGSLKRADLDLSGKVATGDQVVIEVSLVDGAGLSTMKASAIVGVDGTSPPQPVVLDMADAVNPTAQPLGFSWSFTQPDPESGTVSYYWKAYADANDLAGSAWTAVTAGQTSVAGLDFSAKGYSGSQTYAGSAYADGTVLHFAVMAVNGSGLSSVGYSHGIILDRTAPRVQTVAVSDAANNPINQYVTVTNLVGTDGKYKVNVSVDVSSLSGVAGISIQAGEWVAGTGFVPDAGSTLTFTPTPAQVLSQTSYTLPVVLSQARPGSILLLKGEVVNAAGNVAQVLYSGGFKVEGPSPQLTGIQGNLSPDSVSFTWQVDQNTDFIRGYQVGLSRIDSGGTSVPVPIPDADGNPQSSIFITQRIWSGDLKALGFAKGDRVQISVTLLTQLGQSNTLTQTMSFVPDVPVMVAGGFVYTNYFSDHLNVKNLRYQAGTPNVGLEQIQWRVLDAQTGVVLQDWTPDYSANNSPADSYSSEKAPFSGFTQTPVDGERLLVEVKAQSLMGVWSSVTPSGSILVDQSTGAGTLKRPSAADAAVENPYSNGQGGQVSGWSVTAADGESGVLAYEVVLVPAAAVNAAGFDVGSIWAGVTPATAAADPGQSYSAQGVAIAGVNVSTPQPTDYYAFLRVQNGTEDWSSAVRSLLVTVDQTLPVVHIVFPTGSNGVFVLDHQGNPMVVKVTNNALQPTSVTSSKISTTFAVSVNGVTWGSQPQTVNGPFGGDESVLSYGTVGLTGPATDAISVTATDLFGNQVTVADQLRFNQAPTVTMVRKVTTTAQVLDLEQLVSVADPEGDYPLTYQWSLGGGIGMNYTDGSSYLGGPTEGWDPSAYHTVKFLQQGKSQDTPYSMTLVVSDAWGQTQTFSFVMSVLPTASGTLYANEYWTGPQTLTGMVEVPAGITLTLDGAAVSVNGPMNNATPAIMQGGIIVDSGGSVVVANAGAGTTFASGTQGYYWKGILVSGTLQGSGLEVDQAERALVLLSGGYATVSALNLEGNLIGAHLLGGALSLNGGLISGNAEYGVKEDGAGSYGVMNMSFSANGVGYYQQAKAGISMAELNAIPGNGGNQ